MALRSARTDADRMGPALRQACDQAGLTQERIAAELDVHQTTVSKWFVGKTWPPVEALPAIDRLCGQPLGHILRMAGFVDDELDLRAAIRADRSISADQQGALLAVYDIFRTKTALAERGPILSPAERADPDPSPSSPPAKRPLVTDSDREAAEPYLRRGQERLRRGRRGAEVERDRGENNTNA